MLNCLITKWNFISVGWELSETMNKTSSAERENEWNKFRWPREESRLLEEVWNGKDNNNRIQRRCSRFFTISSRRRELSPTRTLKWPGRNRVQITCNTSSAYHVQVSCYVPLGTKEQLSYSVWQSWNRIYLSFIFIAWTIKPMNEGRKPECPEKTPGDELQKMPHTTAWRFKLQARLEPAQ